MRASIRPRSAVKGTNSPSRWCRTSVDLETFWFVLIAILWAGYFALEGFDFGVGMLLPLVGRDDEDRSAMLRTIGPVWDGNEVWLVVAGGGPFAAFRGWYARMLCVSYLALI